MSANLENLAVATGLEKVNIIRLPKKGSTGSSVQTTRQLNASPMLVRFCSKSSKLASAFVNLELQDCKLGLEKAEETKPKAGSLEG